MNLTEFVSSSLKQIIDAVADCAQYAESKGAAINPSTLEWRTDQGQVIVYDEKTGLISSNVEYDVALTISEGGENKGEAGIKVFGATLGFSGSTARTTENQSISRIKFTIPVVFPTSRPRVLKTKVGA